MEYVPDPVKRRQGRMVRRVAWVMKLGVRRAIVVALLMPPWVSRSLTNQAIGQVTDCVASIAHLKVRVNPRRKDNSRPHEAKMTGRWCLQQHELLQPVMIQLAVSLHWLRDVGDEVS